ncbi:MAG: hypothetical protein AB1Z98_28035 [Nannocystaceae bacterium]
MAEWSSAQLDILEDALEDIEHDGALERWLEDDPDPVLRQRLQDYRTLLVASRDALPLQEVPQGVLDDVLEQARQAAAAPIVAAASPSWWSRVRRSFLVPAVALAGTAMLVLWIGRPDEQSTILDEPPTVEAVDASAVERAESAPGSAAASTPTAAPALPRAGAAETAKDAAEGELEAVLEAPPPEPAPEPDADADDGYRDVAAGDANQGRMSTFGEAPSEEQKLAEDKGPAGPATGRWDLISLGDRARQANDCVAARDEYAVALEDDDPRVRARAFAGIGLCDLQAGDGAAADSNFERGRELDDAIDGFIDSQRDREPSPKKTTRKASKKARPTSKPKSKSKSTPPSQPAQQTNPYD